MAEQIHHPDGGIENPSVRFEPTDASFRPILIVITTAISIAVVGHFVLLRFFLGYRDYQSEIKKSPYPLAPGPSTALPRQPRLEQVERMEGPGAANVQDREAANLAVRDSYGPTPDQDFIHVPIERAMQVMIEKNELKSRTEPPADQLRRSGGLLDSGGPNSGRLFKEASR